MISTDIKTIAVRALNHLRKEHLPTYIGLRRLLDSTSEYNLEKWLHKYIVNKPLTQVSQPYFKYSIYKGIDDGELVYRECLAPSPTTCLIESLLLHIFSSFTSFQPSKNVYSYLWPEKDKSGHSYRFFLDGYRGRELDVSKALSEDNSKCAFVTDIKSFYPTIDKDILRQKLFERLGTEGLSIEYERFVRSTVSHLLENESRGVPIGSALGHTIANVALNSLDDYFEERDDLKYYRYVDDIVVVADTGSIANIQGVLAEHLNEWGLELNNDKTETLSSSSWISERKKFRELTDIGFEEWNEGLVLFLAVNDDLFEKAETLFKSNGFNLPFKRYRSLTSYGRFTYYLKKLVSSITKDQTRYYTSIESLVRDGLAIRKSALKNFKIAMKIDRHESHTEQNWHAQTIRYLTNRLLYLSPLARYGDLLEMTSAIPSLSNLNGLIQAMLSQDASHVVSYPGHTVNTFCQLYRNCYERPPKFSVESVTDQNSYAAQSLALHGLIDMEQVSALDISQQNLMLAEMCMDRHIDYAGNDFSYLNEMAALQLPRIRESSEGLLSSRFSDFEDVILDSTLLDSVYC